MGRKVGARLREAARTLLTLVLTFSLAMGQTPTAAAAATRIDEAREAVALHQAEAGTDDQSQTGFAITEDSVTIDGELLFKEDFEVALAAMRRSGTQQQAARQDACLLSLPENGAIRKFDANSASAIASLGLGVQGVFARIAYGLALTSHVGEVWVCVVGGVFVYIYCDTLGMVVNGYSVSHCWLTDMLMGSMESHVADGSADEGLSERTKNEQEVEQELRKQSRPGRKTKKVKQREVEGNYKDAKDWFNKLNPEGVTDKKSSEGYGKVTMGTLSDGRRVLVRENSSSGREPGKNGPPTLEFQRPDGKPTIKYRFING